jgi:hypothetical protein
MNQVLTTAELQSKGITKQQVQAMFKKSETRVNFYAKQYLRNGNKCSAPIQAAWDAECARWDHLKATLAGMQ